MKQKNPHAVALGRLGGARSASTRMVATTPATRSRVARIAVNARWARVRAAKQKK